MIGDLKKLVKSSVRKLGFDIVRADKDGAPAHDPWMSANDWRHIYEKTYSWESVANRRFFNVGAGTFSHFAWTNIDKYSEAYSNQLADGYIEVDLLEDFTLPIENGTAELF